MKGRWLLAAVLSGIGACSSTAPGDNAAMAQNIGAQRELLHGPHFSHVVYAQGFEKAAVGAIDVYIGGDGRAFLNRRRVSQDPTVYPDPTLQMMLEAVTPAFFVSRPCYHGTRTDIACAPELWTTARYSEQVVDSMAAVIDQLHNRYPNQGMRLIGYSGGGVIALFVAARLPYIDRVVTIASPLDTEAWAAYHGYTPLYESRNPATVEHWPAHFRQLHLVGSEDENVPPGVQQRFRLRIQALSLPAEFIEVEDQAHCCWLQSWRRLRSTTP